MFISIYYVFVIQILQLYDWASLPQLKVQSHWNETVVEMLTQWKLASTTHQALLPSPKSQIDISQWPLYPDTDDEVHQKVQSKKPARILWEQGHHISWIFSVSYVFSDQSVMHNYIIKFLTYIRLCLLLTLHIKNPSAKTFASLPTCTIFFESIIVHQRIA